MPSKNIIRDYWEKNIEGFSGFYDTKSEEDLRGSNFIVKLYKKLVFPIEKKYMRDRHNFVCNYIDENVKPGMKVADIGCGSGIYTKRMINKGAYIYAIDYAESAVNLTKKNLTNDEINSVEIAHFDITQKNIPNVDIAISIGVLPYINEEGKYFDNILPYTNSFLFNYLKKNSIINVIRRSLPLLDVRNYSYHSPSEVNEKLENGGFRIRQQTKLATGLIVYSKRK